MNLDLAIDLDEYEEALNLARARLARSQSQRRGELVKRGSHGDPVRALQRRLGDLGYEVSTDGVYGKQTEAAVRKFQKSRNATEDGIVGEQTLGKLLRAHKSAPNPADTGIDALVDTITPNAKKAADAANPQEAMGRGLGDLRAQQRGGGSGGGRRGRGSASQTPKGAHGGAIDPVTGAERATAKTGPIGSTTVSQPSNMSFEEAHPRGETGSATGGQFVKKGDSGGDVQNSQKALNAVNGAGLKVDGAFGPKTDKAVKAYQKRKGLKVDGIVGPKTSTSLRRRLQAIKRRTDSQTVSV